jgi:16S rRNA (cytosine967-C5)-methyltransferase
VLLQSGAAIRELEAFQKGHFTVQDESSMLVAHGLAVSAGDRVLDTCAAPGGKTTHIAQLMQNQGKITAWDIHAHRVGLIKDNSQRLGVSIIEACQQDALTADPQRDGYFDRILVDAPCSGLGVLRRRADARWRKSPEEIRQLVDLQKNILRRALSCLAPGGRLIYSTCTIMPEENEQVVSAILQELPDYQPAPLPFAEMGLGSEPMLQCLPFTHGLEGFFIAAIERKG